MRSYPLLGLGFVVGILLASCSGSLAEPEPMSVPPTEAEVVAKTANQKSAMVPAEPIQPGETSVEKLGESTGDQVPALWPDGEARLDDQGSVEVAVTPLNLNAPDGSLDFSVGLDTHSVDLSMDLAPLARLEADNGLGVQATLWDAPRGGHHVSGVLSFPADEEGFMLLEGASHLTLTIQDLDAPERSFSWSLSG